MFKNIAVVNPIIMKEHSVSKLTAIQGHQTYVLIFKSGINIALTPDTRQDEG